MDFSNQSNDVNILHVPPQYPGDIRVFKAIDFYSQSILNQRNLRNLPYINDQLISLPQVGFRESSGNPDMFLDITNLKVSFINFPSKELSINASLKLFDKFQVEQSSTRFQYLQVFSFLSEVGEIQDSALGSTSLEYFIPNYENLTPDFQEIETQTKENSRRLRSFWGIVLSEDIEFNSSLLDPLINDGDTLPSITIPSNQNYIDFTTNSGNRVRLYILDNNLKEGSQYFIFNDFFSTIPFLKLERKYGFVNKGYYWGGSSYENLLSTKYNCNWIKTHSNEEVFCEEELSFLLSSDFNENEYPEISLNKEVHNLFEGTNNSGDHPGIHIPSPNGYSLLTTPDRAQFKNEESDQIYTFRKRQVIKDNNDNLYVNYPLNLGDISSQNGENIAKFNSKLDSHIIYDNQGNIISDEGYFSIQPDNLTWFPEIDVSLEEGDFVYIQPSIIFKSGSGFNSSNLTLDKCWNSFNDPNEEISSSNIREANSEDIDVYQSPANNENFIVIFGKERNAIHYIYRKVNITSDDNGYIRADEVSNNNGVIAFISGFQGRINKPVVAGQGGFTTYSCLVYHIPKSSEKWQFEFTTTDFNYVNINNLEGARIMSDLCQIAHTQGGGASVYQSGGEMRFSNFDIRLKPLSNPEYPSYSLNTPIIFGEEKGYEGVGWRFVTFPPGVGVSYPKKGRRIQVKEGALWQGNNKLGYLMPSLYTEEPYQSLFSFICQTENNQKLLVIVKSNSDWGTVTFENTNNTSLTIINLGKN